MMPYWNFSIVSVNGTFKRAEYCLQGFYKKTAYLQKSTDQRMQSVEHIYSLDPDMMAIVFF